MFMSDWIGLLLLFLLTAALVFGVRHYALHNLLDTPNHRSSHQIPTPRGGGLACVVMFFIAALVLYRQNRLLLPELSLVGLGLGVAVIGFLDDHRPIAARWRFMVHVLAAALAMLLLQGLPKMPLPWIGQFDLAWLGYALGGLFLIWSINLFNFMDGIDGIATTEAIFVATGLAGFMWGIDLHLAVLAICLAVVCAGFLVWNWPPAKIFMGDVGSGFIGFMLGVLIVLFGHIQSIFGFIGLILFAVFVVDASVTLLRRFLSGQQWYAAHCSHAYQLVAKQYSRRGHLRVVLGVMAINVGYLLPLAWLAFRMPDYAWGWLMIAYMPLIFLALRLKAGCPMG